MPSFKLFVHLDKMSIVIKNNEKLAKIISILFHFTIFFSKIHLHNIVSNNIMILIFNQFEQIFC